MRYAKTAARTFAPSRWMLGLALLLFFSVGQAFADEIDTAFLFRIYPSGESEQVAFSADGERLAVACAPNALQIHDAQSGKLIKKFELLTEDEQALINADALHDAPKTMSLAFSPDSSLIAIGNSAGHAKLFDVQSGQQTMVFDGVDRTRDLPNFLQMHLAHGDVETIGFSLDAKTVVTGGGVIDYFQDQMRRTRIHSAGLVKLWDAKTGKLIADLKNEHSSKVYAASFSPDGSQLATVGHFSWVKGSAGTGLKLWDTKTNQVTKALKIPKAHLEGVWPWSVAFNSDATKIAVGVWRANSDGKPGGSIAVFDTAKGEMQHIWDTSKFIRQVAFTADDQYIIAKTNVNTVTFWDTQGNEKHALRPIGKPQNVRWEHIAISNAINTIAIGGRDANKRPLVDVWEIR